MPSLTVSSLRRYPVKSMGGEQLRAAELTPSGVAGDRAYALVDRPARKVSSAKSARRFGELPIWQAAYVGNAVVQITAPDGSRFCTDSSEAPARVHAAFGPDIELQSQLESDLLLDLPPGTLGGKHIGTTQVPIAGAAPGTFLDLAPIHIITSATLRWLDQLMPDAEIAAERFRPNIVVDCGDESGPVENAWVGKRMSLGSAELRVMMPCPRCVMATLARPNLQALPGLLRTLVKENAQDLGDYGTLPCAGIYCEVTKPGTVCVGHRITGLD